MKTRLVALVAVAWVLIGTVQGAQASLGASLQGRTLPLADALRSSLLQALPWIPVTLAVIALATRFPLDRSNWRRRIVIHLAGALAVAFVANGLVVLGFWILAASWGGGTTLLVQAARWTLIRLHIAIVTYAIIAAVTQTVVARRAARERELRLARLEAQLARARLQALTAQIRPHFLFNTLHTIGQLWRAGHADEADAMLDRLGALFHRVQDTTRSSEVPLAEELDMVRDYLSIEEVRFRDRLRVVISAQPDALDCAVPPLILQPIVENAVRHGISAASTAGRLELRADLANGRLRLLVRDDGPGITAKPTNAGTGTGLRNTRERLTQLYGAAASLAIESTPGRGTTVRLELPARRPHDADPATEPALESVLG